MSDASFFSLAGSLALVAVMGRSIGWALDAWVRRAAETVDEAAQPGP